MKRLMMYTGIVLATLLVLQILWQFRLVLLLLILSLFMAAAIRPFVNHITVWGIPKVAAQLLLYLAGIGLVFFFFFLLGNALILELNIFVNRAVIEYETLYRTWQKGAAWQQTAVSLLSFPPFSTPQDTQLEEMLPAVVVITRNLMAAVGGLLLLLALSVYWSADQDRFERLWLSLLSPRRRAYARDSWRKIEHAVGSYLRSRTVQSMLAALLLGVGAELANLDFPILLALLGGLATFVPFFGSLIMSVVALGLGSLQSYSIGLGAAAYTLCLFVVLEFFVEPYLWPRQRRSFLLTILLVIPLLEAFGLWGLLVAPPLAAAAEVVIHQAYQAYVRREGTAVKLDDLEARYQQILAKANQAEHDDLTPELENFAKRFAVLLTNSRQLRNSEKVINAPGND